MATAQIQSPITFIEPITDDLRKVLAKAYLLTQAISDTSPSARDKSQSAFTYTTLFCALLTLPNHPVSQWLKRYMAQNGIHVSNILATKDLTTTQLDQITANDDQAFVNVLNNSSIPGVSASSRTILEKARTASSIDPDRPSTVDVHHVISAYIDKNSGHLDDLGKWGFSDIQHWSDDFLTRLISVRYPQELAHLIEISDFPRPTALNARTSLFELLNRSELSKFDLTDYVTSVIAQGSEAAAGADPKPMPLTTSSLFFPMLGSGSVPALSGLSEIMRRYPELEKSNVESKARNYYIRHEFWSTYTHRIPPAQTMTSAVLEAFRYANDIARATAGDGRIDGQHLLASMLFNPPRAGLEHGAINRLGDLGIDGGQFKIDFINAMAEQFPDQAAAWRQLPSPRLLNPADTLPGFSSDDPGSEKVLQDKIGVDGRVNALASLIAAKHTTPPLAIGIFGDWGAGKTTFMKLLKQRVDHLANSSYALDQPQRGLTYYMNIVQIEFNAWQYIGGDLWASLVEHIFSNLSLPHQADAGPALRAQFFDQLAFAKAEKETAQAKKEVSDKALAQAQETLDRKKDEVKAKEDAVRQAVNEGDLSKIGYNRVALEEIQTAVAPLAKELKLDSATVNNLATLQQQFVNLRNNVEESRRFKTALQNPVHLFALLFWLFAGSFVAVLVGLLMNAAGVQNTVCVLASTVGVFTAIAGSAGRVLAQINSGYREHLDKITELEQQAYSKIREGEKVAQQDLDRAKKEVENADQEVKAKELDVNRVQEQLKALEPEQLLIKFIKDRTEDNVYKKYLGVTALIRQDFENLSAKIKEINDSLSRPLDKSAAKTSAEATPETETANSGTVPTINRIVLYIDDLDRCPEKNVVEVLQAVHLLLAFPLFIVVVGVDARWVSYSLKNQYPDLLATHPGEEGDVKDRDFSMRHRATPHDYLEKIFQIPIWLEPIRQEKVRDMLDYLIGNVVKTGDEGQREVQNNRDDSSRSERSNPEATQQQDPAGAPNAPAPGISQSPIKALPVQPILPSASEFDPNPKNLDIQQVELDFMKQLASLIGRSPRAVKRYVNTYQLIKAALETDQQVYYLEERGPDSPPDYVIVLFLLSIVTGLPALSREIFYAIQFPERLFEPGTSQETRNMNGTKDPAPAAMPLSFGTLTDHILRSALENSSTEAEAKRLRDWLEVYPTWKALSPKVFADWADDVARYSFRVDMM